MVRNWLIGVYVVMWIGLVYVVEVVGVDIRQGVIRVVDVEEGLLGLVRENGIKVVV